MNVIEQHKKIGLKHICSLAGICLVVTQALAQDPANKRMKGDQSVKTN